MLNIDFAYGVQDACRTWVVIVQCSRLADEDDAAVAGLCAQLHAFLSSKRSMSTTTPVRILQVQYTSAARPWVIADQPDVHASSKHLQSLGLRTALAACTGGRGTIVATPPTILRHHPGACIVVTCDKEHADIAQDVADVLQVFPYTRLPVALKTHAVLGTAALL